MFYAYVLKSVNHDYYYKGHCENLEARLKQHNSGMTKSIKPYIPFEIAYFEFFQHLKKPSPGRNTGRHLPAGGS